MLIFLTNTTQTHNTTLLSDYFNVKSFQRWLQVCLIQMEHITAAFNLFVKVCTMNKEFVASEISLQEYQQTSFGQTIDNR